MTFAFTATDNMTPEGLYLMSVKEIGEPELQDGPYGTSERIRWIFSIEEVLDDQSEDQNAEDYVGEEFWSWTSTAFGPNSNARKWVQALLGRQIENGEQISISEVVGKQAKITVGRNDNGNQKLVNIAPARVKKAKKAKRAPAPVEDEFDDVEPGEDDEF